MTSFYMKTDAFQQRLEMWFIQFSFKGYLDNEIISQELMENGLSERRGSMC